MSRTPASFKRSDVTRAIKAALECGLAVSRTEIDREGRIVLTHPKANEPAPVSDLDAWRATKHARTA